MLTNRTIFIRFCFWELEDINIFFDLLNEILKFIYQGFLLFALQSIHLCCVNESHFKSLALIALILNSALFSLKSLILLLFLLSLTRPCKTNCQFIILEIALANSLNKIWIPLLLKWSFQAYQCLTVKLLQCIA